MIIIATGTWFSLVETEKGKCSENATTDLSDKYNFDLPEQNLIAGT